MTEEKDGPHIRYVEMGPWPGYVGFTTDEEAFQRELKRMGIPERVDFLSGPHADATAHMFTWKGECTAIICMHPPTRRHSREQFAGLVAHEAMHVVQDLWERVGEDKPGKEAEAYLLQSIVQFCLQEAWNTGRSRRKTPRG